MRVRVERVERKMRKGRERGGGLRPLLLILMIISTLSFESLRSFLFLILFRRFFLSILLVSFHICFLFLTDAPSPLR